MNDRKLFAIFERRYHQDLAVWPERLELRESAVLRVLLVLTESRVRKERKEIPESLVRPDSPVPEASRAKSEIPVRWDPRVLR